MSFDQFSQFSNENMEDSTSFRDILDKYLRSIGQGVKKAGIWLLLIILLILSICIGGGYYYYYLHKKKDKLKPQKK